jgi:hypothetical protein
MSTETKSKRIKKVFNSFSEITHLWAHQSQEEARCGNGFFDGEIIYSYGRHFPIARIYTDEKGNKTVFFTTRDYSNTTSKHKHYTSGACSHLPKLYMQNVIQYDVTFGKMDLLHKKNISDIIFDIKIAISKFRAARENKIYCLAEINSFVKRFEDYVTFFRIKSKIDAATKKVITEAKSDKWEKQIEEYNKKKAERLTDPKLQEKREKARKYREEKELRDNAEQIEEWRNFEAYRPYVQKGRRYNWSNSSRPDLMRYNAEKERIETSQGVQIPIELAHRFYRYIKIVLERGSCIGAENCQYQIAGYTVQEITHEHIKVGCHRITQAEIELMATKMKWNNVDTVE